ncbi:hypothetical protein [Mycobacterium sp.]|uniref:hypothetical protein n=1 Tax=Mycobacterium sp. TaxID=1785 RepID=UPI0031D3DE8E
MTDTGGPGLIPEWLDAGVADGISTEAMMQSSSMIVDAVSWNEWVDRVVGEFAGQLPAGLDGYDLEVRGFARAVADAAERYDLPVSDAPGMFEEWRYYDRIKAITPAMIAAGRVAALVEGWAVRTGRYRPPTPPAPAGAQEPITGVEAERQYFARPGTWTPGPHEPSAGGQTVIDAAVRVGNIEIPVPGLTVAQAAAISHAIGLAGTDQAQITAGAIDRMLPGLAPGQVPAELEHLYGATHVLAAQIMGLREFAGLTGRPGLAQHLVEADHRIYEMEQAERRLDAQLRGDDRSRLLELHDENARRIHNQGEWIHHTDEILPTLAPIGVVHELEAEFRHVEAQLSEHSPSYLFDTIRGLETEAKGARQEIDRVAKTSLECCEDWHRVQRDMGGPSAWRQLAKLLGLAATIGWVIGIADAVFSLLNSQVALDGVVVDTEKIATWAVDTSNLTPVLIGWGDRIAGIAA